jgi:hypothetical protein
VMDVEILRCTTSHAAEVILHLGTPLSFCYVEGFATVRIGVRNPNPESINAFIRSGFPTRIVHLSSGFLTQVRGVKSLPSLLRISGPCKLVWCGEPLIRCEDLVTLADRGHPSCASMDDPALGRDESTFPAALVLTT